jgi:hypothetical protein
MLQHFKDHMLNARANLDLAHQILKSEITNYPTPIAGCDEQFNFLLSESKKVKVALGSLDQSVFVPTPRSLYPDSGIESR